MENFQFSFNDIDQTAFNTAFGGDATSVQVAAISDPDNLVSSGGGYHGPWYGSPLNVQESYNDIDQTAFNTAFGGNATSAQVASIGDGDNLFSMG